MTWAKKNLPGQLKWFFTSIPSFFTTWLPNYIINFILWQIEQEKNGFINLFVNLPKWFFGHLKYFFYDGIRIWFKNIVAWVRLRSSPEYWMKNPDAFASAVIGNLTWMLFVWIFFFYHKHQVVTTGEKMGICELVMLAIFTWSGFTFIWFRKPFEKLFWNALFAKDRGHVKNHDLFYIRNILVWLFFFWTWYCYCKFHHLPDWPEELYMPTPGGLPDLKLIHLYLFT